MLHKLSQIVVRFLIFMVLTAILLLCLIAFQGMLKKTGRVSIIGEEVSDIKEITASGITANLFDYYYLQKNKIFLTDEVCISHLVGPTYLQRLDEKGDWIEVEQIVVRPLDEGSEIIFSQSFDRVDYTLACTTSNSPLEKLSFPCKFRYNVVSDSRFTYELSGPNMLIGMYICNDDSNGTDVTSYTIDFEISNCLIFDCDEGKEIQGPFRVTVWNMEDSGFNEEVWGHTGLEIYSINGNECITDSFTGAQKDKERISPDEASEESSATDIAYPDVIFFTFAHDITFKTKGSLAFRYGTRSIEHKLYGDELHICLDDKMLNADRERQATYFNYNEYCNIVGGNYVITLSGLSEDGTGVGKVVGKNENGVLPEQDRFETNLSITVSNSDKRRTGYLEYEYDVDVLEINNVSLFPSAKSFILDNLLEIGIFGLITTIISFIFPAPQNITWKKPKLGKTGKFQKDK